MFTRRSALRTEDHHRVADRCGEVQESVDGLCDEVIICRCRFDCRGCVYGLVNLSGCNCNNMIVRVSVLFSRCNMSLRES